MKEKILSWLLTVGSATVVTFATYFATKIDLLFNPWIKTTQYQWWNMFTTEHYFTWAVYNGVPNGYALLVIVWVAVVIAIRIYIKD